jgi:iron-sulfur cluster assembly protein
MATLTVLPDEDQRSRAVEIPFVAGDILLDRLIGHGVALTHDCGGTLACASCRIIVREGLETLSRATEDEQDMLDRAGPFEPGSRLACQTAGGGADVVIEIPQIEVPREAVTLQATAPGIRLTASAAQHLARQLTGASARSGVRLSVVPAGCSGYRYRVDHAGPIGAHDAVFESRGIRIVVDSASLPRIQGTTVDVIQEGLSRRLRFDNPNAGQTCGCGESFGA